MSQAVRELQPFGAPMSKTASTPPAIRTGVTVLEPGFTSRPYNTAPTVKVASQPVPQLTTSRIPATHSTKTASNHAPAGATQGEPPMTQLNQAKLASGIGVLDTLAVRQIHAIDYIKQASASNNSALRASADDAVYALKVAEQAPDVFDRAYEMVLWGVKQASRASQVTDAAGDAALVHLPGLGRTWTSSELNHRRPGSEAGLVHVPGASTQSWHNLGASRAEATPAMVIRDALQRGANAVATNPYATAGATLAGTAALGGGGYAAYEGLRDRPWYEQLANAAGM